MKICCFGELLLRMSPTLNRQWIHQSQMPVYIGGAELNVASALSKWNTPVKYITALPSNNLANEIVEELQQKNIDTSNIISSGDKIGIYYLPQGTDLKNADVVYDRNYSSFSQLKSASINWDEIFKDCTWFHFSAISPALNAAVAELCLEAVQAAKAKGLTISIDLNYRNKLWQYGIAPHTVMPNLIKYCDVVMGNIWAAQSLLNINAAINDSVGKTNEELVNAATTSMLQIHKQYSNVKTMAFTFRLEKEYFALLQHGANLEISKTHVLDNIVDKVGSGDCFMAGLIYGLINDFTANKTINFAAAAAVSKMSVVGDATNKTIENINQLLLETL